MQISVKWHFHRNDFLPILEVTGESSEIDGELILIKNALYFIQEANNFKGIPYPTTPSNSSLAKISISFSIIFPSINELSAYMENIKENN